MGGKLSKWSKVSEVSGSASLHDSMVDTDFKNLPEGHHLLNLNLNLSLFPLCNFVANFIIIFFMKF
jgi:hypothetical protein